MTEGNNITLLLQECAEVTKVFHAYIERGRTFEEVEDVYQYMKLLNAHIEQLKNKLDQQSDVTDEDGGRTFSL